VPFTALTEDWRLHGRMEISGRLTDALNRREAIAITDVSWGRPTVPRCRGGAGCAASTPRRIVTAGDSLPPLTDTERTALKVHKVAYDVALEVPPFRVVGTVYLHPGSEPDRLLDRSSEMFVPIVEAVARLGDVEVTDPEVEVILVNRFYLRGVDQVDKRTGAPHPKLPGAPLGGVSWQDRSR
jgi:ferredoxin